MATVLDIQEGAELVTTFTNREVVRVAITDNLQGSDQDAMLYDAELALAALTPPVGPIALGESHPTIPTIVVVRMTTTPLGGSAANKRARTEIEYGIPTVDVPAGGPADGDDYKEIAYIPRRRQVTKNPRDGAELKVDPPAEYSTAKSQTKTVTIDEGIGSIVFERSEPSVPTARMRAHQNTVNDVDLPVGGPTVYPAGTLYCRTIRAVTRDQGGLYRVRYEFIYDPDGHKIEYKWEHPSLPVGDYDASSRKEIEREESALEDLNLDFSD